MSRGGELKGNLTFTHIRKLPESTCYAFATSLALFASARFPSVCNLSCYWFLKYQKTKEIF